MIFQRICLKETDSTNHWLWQHGEGNMVVTADYQIAGRGQGEHGWESEAGENLLFSVLLHPVELPPVRQFLLSEAWALSLKEALDVYAENVTIKWPNDIYWKDFKLSGTLIETRLSGGVLRDVVIGTGINVNQTHFVSDAPNPVSLAMITKNNGFIEKSILLDDILSRFSDYYRCLTEGKDETIQNRYHQALYRRFGLHPYADACGRFMAEIVEVAPSGILTLRDGQGQLRHYQQREVRFVLSSGDWKCCFL